MIQLDPPLPFETPKGPAWAHFLIDRGQEHHLQWVTFLERTGECWTFENPDIRLQHNMTMGRPKRHYEWRSYWNEDYIPKTQEVIDAKN